MGIPKGYKYEKNLSIYIFRNLGVKFKEDYGQKLLRHFDPTDNILYGHKIFCLDCNDFKYCKGECWKDCPYRKMAMTLIKGI